MQTEKTEKAPGLYDLTTLQRDANRLLGYTAQQSLDYLQSLYEKKLCTYPRTDSRYLTDDMEGGVNALALCRTSTRTNKADAAGAAFGSLPFCFHDSISQNRKNIDFGK